MFCISGQQLFTQRNKVPNHLGDTTDGGFSDTNRDNCYAKAALYALQKHTDAIINISAVQIIPELYSECLVSAETLSMIIANTTINKYQMLTVYDDLRSKVAVCKSGFVKFVDILRGYPEYEDLANNLQGL